MELREIQKEQSLELKETKKTCSPAELKERKTTYAASR